VTSLTAPAPVYGLVLAGGGSKRMQRDKAVLEYAGVRQLDRVYAVLARHCEFSFVSVRPAQAHEPVRASKPLIVDALDGDGPVAGIRSAMATHPAAAWLVVACDLPFLSDATLARLLAARDHSGLATAYRSSHDGLPEPLCAIWEPRAAQALADYQREGGTCPRKFLIRRGARLIDAPEPAALDNVNTPEEFREAQRRFARVPACN
jgi:molybdopterin-guanine dinucleotide biosynthesis protein A